MLLQEGREDEQAPDAVDDAEECRPAARWRCAIGRRSSIGQSSVRKKAITMPTGTAITMAMTEVTSVP